MAETIAAVVVTYNRLEKLKKVLDTLVDQTRKPDQIIVVDNASNDGTAEFLESYECSIPFLVLSPSVNTGGAGGFFLGMKAGYESGADYLWIMDDDAYAKPDALGNLERGFVQSNEELGGQVPFACSVVEYIDGNICEMNNPVPTWDWGRLLVKGINAVMVSRCSFVSVLIPRSTVKEFGYPYKEYFIWFDDAEYTSRITRDCPGVQVMDSAMIHDMGDNKGVNFTMIDEKNAWKFAYGIRNEASATINSKGVASYLLFIANMQRQMRRGRVPIMLRARMTKRVLEGAFFNPPLIKPKQ
ncbi:glycosyltransferase [Actinomycetaceae bacterium WB03_NA08]|uniref:Glycosyltransferase n=1 Tax=Scrofimicrobium canadense TaxID=2652290 RepID=A0A6N7WB05_9ACTO|nr:glycosyltransferase family 2 protein [Scrofimicrobium canadense]MSS85406.1 glycosyltransferase [Scrofimicrobium canadense]